MLIGSGGVAVPAVVGHVQQRAGPLPAGWHDLAGERGFVADQRRDRRQAGDRHEPAGRARRETAGNVDEIAQAQPAQNAVERQVFAKRDEMNFVVIGEYSPRLIHRLDGIIENRRLAAGGGYHARRPRHQDRLGSEKLGYPRQGFRVARENEGKRRFRPNEMGDIGDPRCLRRRRAVRQREVTVQYLVFVLGAEEFVLPQIGLHEPQLHAGDVFNGAARQADGAERAKHDEGGEAEFDRESAAAEALSRGGIA